jgi:FkbM family methyltransferase
MNKTGNSNNYEINIKQEFEKYLSERSKPKPQIQAEKFPVEKKRHVPSPNHWINEGLKRTRECSIGYKPKDKIKLFELTFFEMIPTFLTRNYQAIYPLKENLKEKNHKQLTVKLNNIIYKIPDYESLRIVSPQFEPLISSWFEPKEGEVFVDIGSHIGKYALKAGKNVGSKGKVVAVEAMPANFIIIKKNVKLNKMKNIDVFNLAAWNTECSLQFLIGTTSANSNINRFNYGQGMIEVQAGPVDKLLIGQLKLKRVDWIKIDVEGAEYQVLQGLKETISKFKPKMIIEIWAQNLAKVQAFLEEHQYRVVKFSGFEEVQSQFYTEVLCV